VLVYDSDGDLGCGLGRFDDDEVVVSGDGEALTLRWIEERFGELSSCSPSSCSSSESSWSWLLVLGSICLLKAERADILLSLPVEGGVICWVGHCVLARFNLASVGW